MNLGKWFGVTVLIVAATGWRAIGQENVKKMLMENLIVDLSSADGTKRVAASAEIFRRGKAVMPDLKKAGAKQVAPAGGTIDGIRRLDMIYSVLEGLPPNTPRTVAGYHPDAFGVYVENGTTEADFLALGEKYGCKLNGKFHTDFRPNGIFQIGKGKSLEEVIRQLLANETKVITIHLSYVERKLP